MFWKENDLEKYTKNINNDKLLLLIAVTTLHNDIHLKNLRILNFEKEEKY